MEYEKKTLPIKDINVAPPFQDLFTIKPEDLQAVKTHMIEYDYDITHPVAVWKQKMILLDGHTRYKAASDLNHKEIPAVLISFKDEQEAIEYAIHNQTERRNLSDHDVLMLVKKIDKLSKNWGGDRKSKDKKSSLKNEKLDTRKRTGDIIGIRPSKVTQCRGILKKASKETIEAIRKEEITIHRAYQNLPKKEIDNTKKEPKENIKEPITKQINHGLLFKYAEQKGIDKKKQAVYSKQLEKLCVTLIPKWQQDHKVLDKVNKRLEEFNEKGILQGLTEQPLIQEYLKDLSSVLDKLGYHVEQKIEMPSLTPKKVRGHRE